MTKLTDNGFLLNQRNDKGETILHEAIRQRKEKTSQWLWNNHRELRTIPDQEGRLPLHYVAKQGNQKLFTKLNPTEKEQDIADRFGKTPGQLLEQNEPFFTKNWRKSKDFVRKVSSNLSLLPPDDLLPPYCFALS